MTEKFVCTLTSPEVDARRDQSRRLTAGLLGYTRTGREVSLRFEPSARRDVRQFVEDESRCCSFFTFAVDDRQGEIILDVGAPEGAEPMLDALVESFVGPS